MTIWRMVLIRKLPAVLCLIVLSMATGGSFAAEIASADPPEAARARAAFERLKGLAGSWRARSTKGWDENVSFQILARGTAVLEMNFFNDNPEENMATVFHLDGDRLMLTHYCEAGNQPRMVATDISPDGKEVAFDFLDATNLPSQDRGHMESADFRFLDDGTFTSRWSFVQNGEVIWAEDIVHRRVSSEEKVASP